MKVEIGDSNTKTKVESEPGNAKLLNSSELNSGKKEREAYERGLFKREAYVYRPYFTSN